MCKNSVLSEELKYFMPDEADLIEIKNHNLIYDEQTAENNTSVQQEMPDMPLIIEADLDGDGEPEIIGAYMLNNISFIIIIKLINDQYYKIADFEGDYDCISYLNGASITSTNKDDLLIGYEDDDCMKLSILDFEDTGNITEIVDHDLYFDDIDIGNLSCYRNNEKQKTTNEIALWRNNKKNQKQLSVYRFKKGKLVLALDAYNYYKEKRENNRYENRKIAEKKTATDSLNLMEPIPSNGEKNRSKKDFDLLCTSLDNINKLKESIRKDQNREDHLYAAREKTKRGIKWGYINKKGNFAIKPKFETAFDFDESGLAVVQEKRKWGVINKQGKFEIKPTYLGLSPFKNERAIAIDQDGFNMIDLNGLVLTKKAYPYINEPANNRALFWTKGNDGKIQYGYLNMQGEEIIPARFEMASDFHNQKAVVRLSGNKYALIDHNGNILHRYNGYYIGELNDNRLVYQPERESKFGYINEQGNVVIQPKYDMGFPYIDEVAIVAVKSDDKRGLGIIGKQGDYRLEPEYNDLFPLYKNRIAVGKATDPKRPYLGSQYALADTSGKIITPYKFSNITPFEDNGYASVYDETQTYFINRQGEKISSLPVIDGTGYLSFANDLIRAEIDNRMMYLNRQGDLVWEQKSTININEDVRIVEEKYRHSKDHIVYYPQFQGVNHKQTQQQMNERLKKLSVVKRNNNHFDPYDYNFYSDFSVISVNNSLVELEINSYNKVNGERRGIPFRYNAHIDITNGKFYELSDLFKPKSNYVGEISKEIKEQIDFSGHQLGIYKETYKGIDYNQPFYIDGDDLYIYFYIYSIAPKEAGYPTFKIPLNKLDDIIDHKSDFYAALKGYRVL